MSKKSILQRQLKREFLTQKYSNKRKELTFLLKKSTLKLKEKFDIYLSLAKLPRDSAKVRLRNRCWKTGRPRGYFRFFGISRNLLRNLSHEGTLSGIIKSSW